MTSVASSALAQLLTLSARYGRHDETVHATSHTTLEQMARLLRRGGGCVVQKRENAFLRSN
jgi:hypothetical protein